ncbi:DoxX family protein [Agrobacterium cavarae]|uniref:DoxX family protein n=1 Tax=Agrobacterium cavarae TaxID=2528239 RepID=UPI003FD0A952
MLTSETRRFTLAVVSLWSLQIVVGLAFIAAGIAKLIGAPSMTIIFDHIGIGQWFRFLTGAIEITGGVLLLWPGRTVFGALLLTMTMIGALFTHFVLIGGVWQPAACLFVLSALLVWLNRAQLTTTRSSGREM